MFKHHIQSKYTIEVNFSLFPLALELFKTAKLIKLTTQHRSEDAEHTALLERMSEGETITADDLRNYETLDVSDEEFEFATILTPGNGERQEFNHIQAKR